MGATRSAARLFVVCGACKSGLAWVSGIYVTSGTAPHLFANSLILSSVNPRT